MCPSVLAVPRLGLIIAMETEMMVQYQVCRYPIAVARFGAIAGTR
jgi:hypothetical protein